MGKRERWANANLRGGLGVRHRLSEESQRSSYRLNGVATSSVVVRVPYPFGKWKDLPFDVGVITRKTASTVFVRWSLEEDVKPYPQEDARYEVDRGRWRILGVMRGSPLEDDPMLELINRLREEHSAPLTTAAGNGSIIDADAGTPPTEENEEMAEKSKAAQEREAAKKAVSNGDLKDRDTYTAKQVATRCGTDSKTMRKFFRSTFSTVEPVGQGGRYEFAAGDLPKIQKEFSAWSKRASERRTRPTTDDEPTPSEQPKKRAKAPTQTKSKPPEGYGGIDRYGPNDPDPAFMADDDTEPTDEELAEIDDVELDDIEVDD